MMKKLVTLVVIALLAGLCVFSDELVHSNKVSATQHGYCGHTNTVDFYINYDKTEIEEFHAGRDIIYLWIAKSELILKYENGQEYGRYPIYIKKVNNKFYYSEWTKTRWYEVDEYLPQYETFCKKAEEYVFANDEEKIRK